jgi:formylglycine-generating enzyme required for sulfatase activity/dienelactone hydrolase/predicted Ser/Thr protein kinase
VPSLTKTLETPVQVIRAGTMVAGKYKVLEELGHGGMGIVYKAEDVKLKRFLALKFLPPHLVDSPELKERFLVEAQAAAALNHPNICVIHEVGEDEGRPYIAMEYVEGETLRDRLRIGPLRTEDALDIAIQVAAGLGEAHHKGIIHRDIKSANIMVTTKGQAKVMDFGLAKLRGGSSLTKSQTTIGTVAYMSPEQAQGADLDQRTDLWSLGVVLYEMLTGDLPFKGDRDLSVIYSIVHGEPKSLKVRKPPVPEELQQVIGRALRKKLGSRYGSAEEVLADLKAYQSSLQMEGSGVLNLRTLGRRLRKPQVAVPAVVALALLAFLGTRYFKHQAQVRWARQVALPEIERLATDFWGDFSTAYRLAEEAEKIVPRDPKLVGLFSRCALKIDIKTEPAGAKVFFKEYKYPDKDWAFLGVTPLENVRLPIGVFRWKIEKEDYETVLAVSSTWDMDLNAKNLISPNPLVRVLDEKGVIPPGMVRVPGSETAVGKLPDFFIDRCEVTNRQFKDFVTAGGYRDRKYWKHRFFRDAKELSWEEAVRMFVDQAGQPGPATWQAGDFPEGQGDYPVSGVSWYEAAAYAEFAGKTLATAQHWGLARGENTTLINWPQLGGYAVFAPFSNFSGKGPVPVGSLDGPTAYGAFDLAGNVREWCSNEIQGERLIRGGAWNDNTYMFGYSSRAPAMDRSAKNGLRCAIYPDPKNVPAAAFAEVKLPEVRDYAKEKPVADSVFRLYRELYSFDKTDLKARVESREERPDWVHETVSFEAAYAGERVFAHLFLPKNVSPPYQTVVYFPGAASFWLKSSRDLENYYEFTVFLSFLVKYGRAVVYPVYKGTFERNTESTIAALNGDPNSYQFAEVSIQQVKDLRRTIDYLETRPEFDRERIGYEGMSSGGTYGAIVPAVEDRIRASVLIAGSIQGLGRPEVYEINFLGRVKIPTLMLNGRYDTIGPLEQVIRPMFDLLGTPAADKRLILYETDHIPPVNEMIKETLAWMDKYLGPVKR